MAGGPTKWGHDSHELLTLAAAWKVIADNVRSLPAEPVPICDATGRVLAEPVIAREDDPPFDKSMMDGFAVRAADCTASGTALRVVGIIAAGQDQPQQIESGQAALINTGGPLPASADAVVRVEDTSPSPDEHSILVRAAVAPGKNVSARGCNMRKGGEILSPPIRLLPAQIAAAAAAGIDTLTVTRQVGVAIVATGDELVLPGQPRRFGQIYESNGLMLTALMRQFGAIPHDLGIARDTMDDLRPHLQKALQQPVVLTAGGMSMGTLDLVPKAFESLGIRWLFHGVELRPGKPVAYGRGPDGQHILGLPGNPVSAFVCSWLFARMIIRGLQGFEPQPPRQIRAILAAAIKPARDPRPAFVPAKSWNDPARGLMVEPVPWRGSGDPFGLARANALLCRPQPTHAGGPGDDAGIILVDGDL